MATRMALTQAATASKSCPHVQQTAFARSLTLAAQQRRQINTANSAGQQQQQKEGGDKAHPSPGHPLKQSMSSSILLSPKFALADDWAGRLQELEQLRRFINDDVYEWIIQIQKKYSSGAKASAIDLDVACTLSTQPDQIAPLIRLCHKLRHTDNAADLLPSTEYAMLRLILERGHAAREDFFTILNDPFNYGLFPNEHCCCLYLDHFMRHDDLQAAARLAGHVMQQEMFAQPLLTFLSLRALLQLLEEAPHLGQLVDFEESVLPRRAATLEEELSFTEENVRYFRYPWLKVPFHDGHFDLDRADQLVGKSLEWLGWHLKLAGPSERATSLGMAIDLIGLILQGKCAEAGEAMEKARLAASPTVASCEPPILLSALRIARPYLAQKATQTVEEKPAEGEGGPAPAVDEQRKAAQQLLAQLEALAAEIAIPGEHPPKLWPLLDAAFQPIQAEEEQKLMAEQRKQFGEWAKRRMDLMEDQAQRLEATLRLEAVQRRRQELGEELELFGFFDNRPQWEDRALQRRQLEERLGYYKKRGSISEEEYGKLLFHMGQQLKEGKSASEALDKLGLDTGIDVTLKSKTEKRRVT